MIKMLIIYLVVKFHLYISLFPQLPCFLCPPAFSLLCPVLLFTSLHFLLLFLTVVAFVTFHLEFNELDIL